MKVSGLLELAANLNLARLDSDTVVTYAEATADNVNHVARLGVDGIGVGAVLGRRDEHIEEIDVL